jgi:hypothetical protein
MQGDHDDEHDKLWRSTGKLPRSTKSLGGSQRAAEEYQDELRRSTVRCHGGPARASEEHDELPRRNRTRAAPAESAPDQPEVERAPAECSPYQPRAPAQHAEADMTSVQALSSPAERAPHPPRSLVPRQGTAGRPSRID